MKKSIILLLILLGASTCNKAPKQNVSIEKDHFGKTKAGKTIDRYTLSNQSGMRVQIITYGGIVSSLNVPDINGKSKDVVLGYDNLLDYENGSPYFGSLIGRYGNRIANGKFSLNRQEYTLIQNNGKNHLHGGIKGFDKVVWTAETETLKDKAKLKLSYLSQHMEEGYPGNLNVEVIYTLTDDNSLEVDYRATTDQPTVVNLTQHSYFNLGDEKDILNHQLLLNADAFLPVDETLIPTGKIKAVEGTPFDFRTFKTIGKDIENDDPQLIRGKGYDHCWVLNEQNTGLRTAAILKHPATGIQMEVLTNEPGIQFYSGNFLDGTNPKKNSDSFYDFRSGLCLETQHYPNSPNEPAFPSVVVNPDKEYTSKTTFKFSN